MISRILPIGMASSVALAALGPARKVLAVGDESASPLALRVTARAACQGKRVMYVCGDNRFDPYAVARLAKSWGRRAEDALRSILIARAFTAYQLSELVSRLGQDCRGDFVVISGPCSTFMDDDVPVVDAARLFYRMLWELAGLARDGRAVMLAQDGMAANPRRAYFLTDLCRASDVVLRLGGRHSFTLERRLRPQLSGSSQHMTPDT